jgi:hypothetical protein
MQTEKQPGSLTKNVARAAEHTGRALLSVHDKMIHEIDNEQSIGQQVLHQQMACLPVKIAAS